MSNTEIQVTNFWLRKKKEGQLLRIVEWAQFHGIPVEDLTETQIRSALETVRLVHNIDDE